MRILILTHPPKTNYGGILQAYALQKVLLDMGHNVVTDREACMPYGLWGVILTVYHFFRNIWYKFKHIVPINVTTENIISEQITPFVEKNILTTHFFINNHYSERHIYEYDAFVVGSDQIWRKGMIDFLAYSLPFLKGKNKIAFSYAASFGKGDISDWTEKEKKTFKENLQIFKSISVRESSGVKICREVFDRDASLVLDPTLLLDSSDYRKLIPPYAQYQHKGNLFCYLLDRSTEKYEIIKKVEKSLNLVSYEIMPKVKYPLKTKNIEDYKFCSVEEWISSINEAEFVITDSFHGMVFSIVFNKPFIVIANVKKGLDRFTSLLDQLGLTSRLVFSADDVKEDIILKHIDYKTVNRLLSFERQKSIDFIQCALS